MNKVILIDMNYLRPAMFSDSSWQMEKRHRGY